MQANLFTSFAEVADLSKQFEKVGFSYIHFEKLEWHHGNRNIYFNCCLAPGIMVEVIEHGINVTITRGEYVFCSKNPEVRTIDELVKHVQIIIDEFNDDCLKINSEMGAI